MTHVANLELCKELYELSGWDDTHSVWAVAQGEECKGMSPWLRERVGSSYAWHETPAYPLGHLLRKLPKSMPHKTRGFRLYRVAGNQWQAGYIGLYRTADTPEDATCKLAIQLFKDGVLSKEE